MTLKKTHNGGFTLIELLVVISIIGLLSSVVIANLNQAKFKARDARLKSDMHQMQILLNQEWNDTKSYVGLQPYWNEIWVPFNNITPPITYACGEQFPPNGISSVTSKYKPEMIELCNDVLKNAPVSDYVISLGQDYYVNNADVPGRYQLYSIMILLNTGKYICAGSSGTFSENVEYGDWTKPGCYSNP